MVQTSSQSLIGTPITKPPATARSTKPIAIVAAATLVVYIIYCASPDTAERFGTPLLVLTTPFPIYGIFRYLYLVHRKHGGGSPSDLLLRDRPLLSCVALWGIAVVLIIYRPYAS